MQSITNKLKNAKETLAVLIGITTSIATILQQMGKHVFSLTKGEWLIIVDLLNLSVLAIALWLINYHTLHISEIELNRLVSILTINRSKIKSNHIRANKLVHQLTSSLKLFFAILLLFYVMQIIVDYSAIINTNNTAVDSVLNNNNSWIEILKKSSSNNFSPSIDYNVAKFLVVDFFGNVFNLISAAFLFIAFQVLYVPTLAQDNRTNLTNYFIPFSIAIIIILMNILFVFVGVGDAKTAINLNISTHMIRLSCGIYNGVAMSLLFSRFIGMEYFFKEASTWKRRFYFIGTVVFLPLYIVAQPLYGLFDAITIGGTEEFKTLVFLLCFWGKLFFILFMYTTLSKKWIHAYLLMVISNKDTLKEISVAIEEMKDFDVHPAIASNSEKISV